MSTTTSGPELDAIARVLASGRVISGPEVEAFEQELAAEWGGPGWHAVCVSSGTAALQGALVGAKYVAQPSFTFRACAEATLLAGATPVYLDVDSNYLMDWNQVPEFCDTIISVDLYGRPNPPMRTVYRTVIQDASQAFGCKLYGEYVTTSFYPSKNLGGVGEGGAILTRNKFACEKLRAWRNHGWNGKSFGAPSGNYRMGEINAAVLRVRLKSHRSNLAERTRVARAYHEALPAGLVPPTWSGDHTWNNYTVRGQVKPPEFRVYYEVHGTVPGISLALPNTKQYCNEVFSLPTLPGTDPDAVLELLRQYYP